MNDSGISVPDRCVINIKDIPGKMYSEMSSDAYNSNESHSQSNENNVEGHGAIVAAHYNTIEEKGLEERRKSRIVYLRNFNNWIKSMLIDEYLQEIKYNKKYGAKLKVLDMCCGKGGDLFKWRSGKISHLICADLAETSVEQCEKRFKDLQERAMNEPRWSDPLFTAEFISADCTKVRIRQKYQDVTTELDLVSCQFSFHYSFESLSQAECLLRNASECLQPGGYFIGTMPDAYEIVSRLEKSDGLSFGNEVYNITFESKETPFPLFGGKYNFHLEGVVDCPEFLVHFPTLEKLALKYGLELIRNNKFEDYFNSKRKDHTGRNLLAKMQALETYPPADKETKLIGNEETDYEHAKKYMKENERTRQIGTLSHPEWEAATLYLVFAFRKMVKSVSQNDEVIYTPFVPKPKERDDNEHGEPRRKYQRTD
ncbi:mRNA cap guanine-N7 methyltransferase [Nilaparvata lugens]|uniref:mRNA cap guanine-N7 methyltransferase n=1 Tax=Nilaparvata lugens TaxID=108931 RepID=UPI000B990960|nr:mRNA cap guanine-N7 methyltransferase [Nilaparvata lugens]XP_039279533.1 mRNA cap guanine-N7 methyltransferase [Nilaparvata lugens]XP_039279534.1 mRNA cap guanine-N7 methyltransferase [Nilaparvata lugens]